MNQSKMLTEQALTEMRDGIERALIYRQDVLEPTTWRAVKARDEWRAATPDTVAELSKKLERAWADYRRAEYTASAM